MTIHRHTRKRPTPSDTVTLERTAALFRALADAPRLRILEVLSSGERCVSELADGPAPDGMSTVSQRLRVLHAERLVTKRRDGKHIHYALADEHVVEFVRAGIAHVTEKELSLGRRVPKEKTTPR